MIHMIDNSPFRPSLASSQWRALPFVWMVGGTVLSVAGYAAGTNDLSDVGLHIAILSFVTAVYLSLFIADRRRPQDILAVLGYLLYAVGFAFLSSPPTFAPLFGLLPYEGRAIAAVCLAALLPLTWYLFVNYMLDIGDTAERNQS